MKKILIVNCHPDPESFNSALVASYKKGLSHEEIELQEIVMGELDFKPNLQFGYLKRMELEPDLLVAWEKIQWAHHLVFFMPTWWGGMPAMAKGFFDRLFLPGMAYKFREKSRLWDRLLMGKTAHLVVTMDTPYWMYRFFMGNVGIRQLKNNILAFCGVRTREVTVFSPVSKATDQQRKKYLTMMEKIGKRTI